MKIHFHKPEASSQIKEFGYDAASNTLAVRFKSGGEYHYNGVPQETFDAMHKSSSIGSFLHTKIKGKFDFKKIEQP